MVMDYLACGIDPQKDDDLHPLVRPALNQLMLPFLSLVSESELERNPTVKAEQEASGHALTGLLLTLSGSLRPATSLLQGQRRSCRQDQLTSRSRVRSRVASTSATPRCSLRAPKASLPTSSEVPGLDVGARCPKSYKNSISLCMTADETAKIVKKSPDGFRSQHHPTERTVPASPHCSPPRHCAPGRAETDIAAEIGDGRRLSVFVIEAVNGYFAPIRARVARSLRMTWTTSGDVLHEGNRKANEISERNARRGQRGDGNGLLVRLPCFIVECADV